VTNKSHIPKANQVVNCSRHENFSSWAYVKELENRFLFYSGGKKAIFFKIADTEYFCLKTDNSLIFPIKKVSIKKGKNISDRLQTDRPIGFRTVRI